MKSSQGSERMIKWVINWIASVLTMHLFAVFLEPWFGNHTPIIPHNAYETMFIMVLAVFISTFEIFCTYITERLLRIEAKFEYTMSIIISVLVTASASILVAYLFLYLVD
jgi:hypothetical protein